MSGIETFELWLEAFFTLALFSFLYKDNPIYKIAEHIFAGLTAGYQVGLIWDTVILQKLWDPMLDGRWWLFVPGILGFLMFARFLPGKSWMARTPLAIVMAVTAGVFLTTQLHGLVLPQMKSTMEPPVEVLDREFDVHDGNIARFAIVEPGEAAEWPADTTAVPMPSAFTGTTDTLVIPERSITVIDPVVTRSESDSVMIAARFYDAPDRDIEDYRVSFSFLNQQSGADTILLDKGITQRYGLMVQSRGAGEYLAAYTIPGDVLPAGTYDVKFTVERVNLLYLLWVIVVVGVCSTLIYFYFSHEHVGVLGVTAKVGIWFIMVSFGAHFGYTVMGRVSLLIGRVQFLVEDWIGSFGQMF